MDLFNTSLIANISLPSQFVIRPLQTTDYEKGFLDCLSQLTIVGKLTKEEYLQRFFFMQQRPDHYFVTVIEDLKLKRIAAAGTLAIEYKFIHKNGSIGHIEDIVVGKEYRGLNFGKYIIEQLKHIGLVMKCYKIILDCSQKNVAFYEKCGFVVKELQMVHYIDENDLAKDKTNLKKSWHPLTLRNQEIVWLAEQTALEEERKRELKRKELEREKQMAELQKIQEEAGLIPKRAERLDWMYAGTATQANILQEDFLLGRKRIDESVSKDEVAEPINKLGSLFSNPLVNAQKEWDAKMREDPLFAIKMKEKEISGLMLSKALMMKKIEKAKKEEAKKSSNEKKELHSPEKKKLKRHRTSESERERDDDRRRRRDERSRDDRRRDDRSRDRHRDDDRKRSDRKDDSRDYTKDDRREHKRDGRREERKSRH